MPYGVRSHLLYGRSVAHVSLALSAAAVTSPISLGFRLSVINQCGSFDSGKSEGMVLYVAE